MATAAPDHRRALLALGLLLLLLTSLAWDQHLWWHLVQGSRTLLRLRQGCAWAPKDWPRRLPQHERTVFSQSGEDGLIEAIFQWIGTTNRFYVEFGVESGAECNTRLLRERGGWGGLLMDGGFDAPAIGLHRAFVTPANINPLLDKYSVPAEFDLLSIDVNFDDFWVWKAIEARFRPRVVVIEYNAAIPAEERRVIDPEDPLRWPTSYLGRFKTTTNYWGASLRALADLGRSKGYALVACNRAGVNAFFVRADILRCQGVAAPPLAEAYVHNPFPTYVPETNSSRRWLFLDERLQVVARVPAPDVGAHSGSAGAASEGEGDLEDSDVGEVVVTYD